MENERWLRVEELYHRALDIEESRRAEFLASACAGDRSLSAEIESLLAQEKNAECFLESPALEVVGKWLARSAARASDDDKELIGSTVSHYRVVARLAGGGMGVVYKAEDQRLRRFVALKFLPRNLARDPQWLGRFQREAQAASALSHPNICTIYDVGENDGNAFIAMEFLDGQTLKRLIGGGPLRSEQALTLGIQIGEALEAAHANGIVHRDVKPANIFVSPRGHAKLLDFGVALVNRSFHSSASGRAAEPATVEEDLTAAGVQLGTAAYMSPEQVRGEELDARSDLFSFGVVLYEMTTGKRPFQGNTAVAILQETPPSALQLNPSLPPKLSKIIGKALEKNREQRYQRAGDLVADLKTLKWIADRGKVPEGNIGKVALNWAGQNKLWLASAAVMLLVVTGVAGGALYRARQAKHLTERDTVVLADFDNQTGEPVFNDALKEAWTADLEESPFLNVLAERKVSQTLRAMGQASNERITQEVGRQICQRTGSKALLAGSISGSGKGYLVSLSATSCTTGERLANEHRQAVSKDEVLSALSEAVSRLRSELGESIASVEKFGMPIAATTTSLEALNQYSMALRIRNEKGNAASIPFLKGAIELDPNFPMAYTLLAVVYSNLDQPTPALEYATKGYQLRERATEREKLRISSTYFRITGEWGRAVEAYQRWIAEYPHDLAAHVNLGVTDADMGQHSRALAEIREALRIAPESGVYSNLGWTYINLDRLTEAQESFNQALARGQDGSDLHVQIYALAFLQGDKVRMAQQLAWGADKPGNGDALLSTQSDTEAFYGRLRRAREFSRRAVDSALRSESKEAAALWQVNAALREAEVGNTSEADKGVAAALALSQGKDVKVVAALVLARLGEPEAQSFAAELATSYPKSTIFQSYWLPTITAAFELHHGHSSQALTQLEAARAYEAGLAGMFINYYYPAFVRGQAYLHAHDGAAAVAEFQKLVDHPGIVTNFVTGSIAHLEIGRAYAESGRPAEAKAAYQEFLTLWKDADPDIPILKEAKVEYAKLRLAR